MFKYFSTLNKKGQFKRYLNIYLLFAEFQQYLLNDRFFIHFFVEHILSFLTQNHFISISRVKALLIPISISLSFSHE